MIIGENFFFTEFEKTGTSFLREYFNKYKDVKLSVHHDFIDEKNNYLLKKKYRITTIRNPFSWYVSLWKWSSEMKKKSPFYSDLTSRRIKFRRLKFSIITIKYLYIQLSKNTKDWEILFSDPKSKINFNIWIKKILNKKTKLELGSDYSFTLPDSLGYMTFQFLIRNVLRKELKILYNKKYLDKNPIDVLFEKKFTNYTIVTENLIEELKIFLKKINYKTLNFEELNYYQPKDKTSEYLNFYDAESKNLVLNKESKIFKYFYPNLKI